MAPASRSASEGQGKEDKQDSTCQSPALSAVLVGGLRVSGPRYAAGRDYQALQACFRVGRLGVTGWESMRPTTQVTSNRQGDVDVDVVTG